MGNRHGRGRFKNNPNQEVKFCVAEYEKLILKVTALGDEDVGKTSLLLRRTTGKFPENVPTVFDNYTIHVEGLEIGLWDTSGSEEYNILRPLSYPGTDVFLLLFSLVNPKSLESARTRWTKEIVENSPNVPLILVGTCMDERNTSSAGIGTHEGEMLAEEIGAANYIEVSAKTGENVSVLFDDVAVGVGKMTEPPQPHLPTPQGRTVKRAPR